MNELETLKVRRETLRAEADKLLADNPGGLLGEDSAHFEALTAELATVQERAEKIAELERLAADPANHMEPAFDPSFYVTRSSDPWETADRSGLGCRDVTRAAVAAVEQTTAGADSARQATIRLLERADSVARDVAPRVLAGSAPDYTRAFAKYLAYGPACVAQHTPSETRAWQRAMTLGSNAQGGFMVPTFIDPTIVVTNAGSTNPIRQIARVVQIASNQWNGIASAGVTASWDAESAEVSDDTPVLTQPSVDVHKAAVFVPFSIEAEQDISSLTAELGRLFADAKDRLEAAAFTTGSGSGEPAGIVTRVAATTASRVAATTNNAFGLVDTYALIEALPARHRPDASWCANLSIINDIRQFGTANNYHGFTADLVGDMPATVLGKPIYETSDMDGTIGTQDDDILLVGDFSQYVIADRVGMSVELVPHLVGGNRRPTGERGLYGYWRTGGDVVNVDAFRILRV